MILTQRKKGQINISNDGKYHEWPILALDYKSF